MFSIILSTVIVINSYIILIHSSLLSDFIDGTLLGADLLDHLGFSPADYNPESLTRRGLG